MKHTKKAKGEGEVHPTARKWYFCITLFVIQYRIYYMTSDNLNWISEVRLNIASEIVGYFIRFSWIYFEHKS